MRTLLILTMLFLSTPILGMGGSPEPHLNKQIGQMILIGFNGTYFDSVHFEPIKTHIASGNIGGLIFFGRNIHSKPQITRFINDIKAVHPEHPLFLAIDQEGGTVQRLNDQNGFPNTPSAKHMSNKLTPIESATYYDTMASALHNAGFNLNFGLVLDLDRNPHSKVISQNERSFSHNPITVSQYALPFIRAHKNHNVLVTAKHFPGHGSTAADSHHESAIITNTWQEDELTPYRHTITQLEPDAIMMGHLINAKIDSKHPASLSKAHIGILRRKLHYKGLIITDDLNMAAIRDHYTLKDTVINAVKAGNDIILFGDITTTPQLPITIRNIIVEAIDNGKLSAQDINRAYKRIRAKKTQLRL